jgi:hypothetical protein
MVHDVAISVIMNAAVYAYICIVSCMAYLDIAKKKIQEPEKNEL